jgi:hypothetical protein
VALIGIVISQKMIIIIVTAVETSNLIYYHSLVILDKTGSGYGTVVGSHEHGNEP